MGNVCLRNVQKGWSYAVVSLEDHAHLNFRTNDWKRKSFVDMVKQWWDSYQFFGTPCFVLANKLKWMKLDLKRWKEVFENVEERKKSLLEEIQVLDYLEEKISLVEEEKVKRATVKADLENVALMQEASWRQKSRATSLKEGDHHTRIFHHLANSHKRNNFIPVFASMALLLPIKRQSNMQSFSITRISLPL